MAAPKITLKDMKLLREIAEATQASGSTFAKPASVAKFVDLGLVELGPENPDNSAEVYVRATQKGLDEYGTVEPNEPAAEPAAENPEVSPENNETSNGAEIYNTSVNSSEDTSVMSENIETAAVAPATRTHRPHVMVDPASIVRGMGLPPTGKRGGGSGRKSVYDFASLAAPQLDAAGNILAAAFFFVPATDERPNPARSLNATVSGANKKAAEAGADPATGRVAQYKVYEIEHNGVTGAGVYRIG